MTYNCTKNTPPTIANFTELANAPTINPLLDQLPTTMTYHSSARWLNRLIIAC